MKSWIENNRNGRQRQRDRAKKQKETGQDFKANTAGNKVEYGNSPTESWKYDAIVLGKTKESNPECKQFQLLAWRAWALDWLSIVR